MINKTQAVKYANAAMENHEKIIPLAEALGQTCKACINAFTKPFKRKKKQMVTFAGDDGIEVQKVVNQWIVDNDIDVQDICIGRQSEQWEIFVVYKIKPGNTVEKPKE